VHEQLGAHPFWTIPVLGTVHSDTLIMTWIVMGLSLLFFAWVGNSYRTHRVKKTQAAIEGLVNYLSDLALSTLGKSGVSFVPLFIAFFFLIFFMNQIGFIPLKQLGLPFGGSPTADLNTTAAFALIVFVLIQVVAVRRHGIGYYKHLAQPFAALAPINFIEELARPLTLALRLFFNIFVGEILLFVIGIIITSQVKIGAFDLSLAAAFIPLFVQFLNFAIGTLQAFIFVLISIVYLSFAVAEESH